MKEIKFNIPLQDPKSTRNVIKFLNEKKPLHGPGKNISLIKKKNKKNIRFQINSFNK